MELFSKKGAFVMPSATELAKLDDATRERFKPVQEAAESLAVAESQLTASKEGLKDANIALDTAQKDLRALRPPVSAVDAAKAWIASERAQR